MPAVSPSQQADQKGLAMGLAPWGRLTLILTLTLTLIGWWGEPMGKAVHLPIEIALGRRLAELGPRSVLQRQESSLIVLAL